MAKVKINNLPDGFTLENGKLVKQEMNYGGSTGDQIGYSLEKYPTRVTSQQMSDDENVDVRYSLSSVPREEANIEAEGGETVLTDLNNDGNFGLYNITGPRHSSGGVPMFLPEQSFIFSDTKALKMKGKELAEFGIETKKSMTPASVSKRFGLNKFYGALEGEFADDIQATSAELMLNKNKMNLSKLAYGQELSKDFEDGVPLAAHPYLMSIGQDPIRFTAQVEGITEQRAIERAMQNLSPQQREQVMMLQNFLAQADQQQGIPSAPLSSEAQLAMEQNVPGGPMSNGELPMAQEGNAEDELSKEEATQYYGMLFPEDSLDEPSVNIPSTTQFSNASSEDGSQIEGGSPEFLKYYDDNPSYRNRIYKAYKVEMDKAGQTPVSEDEFHRTYKDAQRRNYELANYADQYNKEQNLQPGDPNYIDIRSESFDSGYKYKDSDGKVRDHGVSKSLSNLIESYNQSKKDEKGFTPLTIPSKEETYTFQQGYRGNLYSEAAEQYKLKKEGKDYDEELLGSFFATGADDEDADKLVLNPYWKQGDPEEEKYFRGVSKADDRYGNTTLGQKSRIKITKTPKKEEPVKEKKELDVPDLGGERKMPEADFWKQDLLKMNAIAQRQRELIRPFQPGVEDLNIDYVLEDPTRAVAAINEQANIMNVANNMYAGPQAGSARSSSTSGKAMKAVADAVAGVQARNVSTANRGEYQNAMLDATLARERRDRTVKEYDGTTIARQAYIDEKNFDREQYADAYANALTNRGLTQGLNFMTNYYGVDPASGGLFYQTGSRAFDPVQQVDQTQQLLNMASQLKAEGITPTADLLNRLIPSQNAGMTTNVQAEMNRMNQQPNQYPGQYPGNISTVPMIQGAKGLEVKNKLKRYANPFYIGTTLL